MEKKGLPPNAYEIEEGDEYKPLTYGQTLPEFTVKAAISGIILGIVFGAANTYLGLRAGLTISTSIPVAVLTVVAFRFLKVFGTEHSILEANMSQTIGSASSSVASGVLFTIPALFLWNVRPSLAQITMLSMAGGLLGVLSMIPLRRYLIKREHGKLPYPEGMACAEVLVASEEGGKQASGVFYGLGFGMLMKWVTDGLQLIGSRFDVLLGYKARLSIGVSPALMGVGYILGMRIATVMVAGAALSAFVIIPVINWWGSGMMAPVYPETEMLIRDMTAGEIWNRYIRYIGAGAVAMGGFITLIKSIPTMMESFKLGVSQITSAIDDARSRRIDQDLSMKIVLSIVAVILLVLTFTPGILGYIDTIVVRGVAAILIAIFAFFFVTVSSRIVGMVGVTSNPTSGMTIATLLGTSFIFYLLGWTDMAGKATALMVGTGVCIAASIAGDTSQDLKTGFILGATPYRQQIGELIGVITSAGFVCLTIILLDRSFIIGSVELPAPQGVLMQLVIDGVIDQNLPWTLIFIGMGLGLVVMFFRVPVLAFAVGVYLPLSTMAPIFLGGFLRHLLTRNKPEKEAKARREQGVLFGSGLVGGEGLMGVLLAAWVAIKGGEGIQGLGIEYSPFVDTILALLGVLVILYVMYRMVVRKHILSTD